MEHAVPRKSSISQLCPTRGRCYPACASCHKIMDPIGFALENFDAVGVRRSNDGGFRVDPNGQLFFLETNFHF